MIDAHQAAMSSLGSLLFSAARDKQLQMHLYAQIVDIASNTRHTRWLSPLLLIADACLCTLVILNISCKASHTLKLLPILWRLHSSPTD